MTRSTATNERGIALVLSLFLMMAMSVVAASLMFLSQTETYASMNYRLMSQARYGGESGVQKTVHFLLNSYTPPDTAADPVAAYNINVSPVTLVANGRPVVLSANSAVASNYPVETTQTAFQNAVAGSMPAGNTTVNYTAYATLMSMRMVDAYGSTTKQAVQTWLITADCTISTGRTALVQVTATLERQIVPAFPYAAFGIDPGCNSLDFSGGGITNSFDSSTYSGSGTPAISNSDGNIGSNGNLTEAGAPTTVNGTLYTPRTGVGNCDNNSITAWTDNGNAQVTAGVVQLPQTVSFATPDPPNPPPPTTDLDFNAGCGGIGSQCAVVGGNVTLTPGGVMSLGNISLTGNNTLHLNAGTYNINSIKFTGNSTIVIDSGPVILNVAGSDGSGGYLESPVDFEGQAASNATFDPAKLQIKYAGTGAIKVTGGTDTAAYVYAPNADVTVAGGADWYGSIIAHTVNVSGGASIHYDRHSRLSILTPGNYMLSAFSWKKF